MVAVVTAAFTLGGGTVALARPALPRPLRDAARMAGLPVNPEPADRVQIERTELERSLDMGNVTRVQADLGDLDRAESKLTPTQRARAQVADDDLEQRARTVVGGSEPAPVGESKGSDAPATAAPTRPEPTEAQPASSPPPAAGDDRSSATTAPSGHDTGGDGSTEPAPPPPPPAPQETTTSTTTTQPPSSSDDGHSTSTSSTGSGALEPPTVDH